MSKLSFSILRNRNFRTLLCTRVFLQLGLQAQAVIVGWQIYSITKSTLLLGVAGLTEAIPAILGALVAGHVVDTVGHPVVIYRLCIAALMTNMLVFLLFAGGMAAPPGGSLLPWIFGGIFFSGLARSFVIPTSFSLLPHVVPRSEFPAAAAWQVSGFQVASITGPAIAGLVYGGYGAHRAWILPALLMGIACLTSNLIRLPRHPPSGERRESAVKSIHAGWKFIAGHPVLLSVMSLDMFAVLFGGATAMLPAYADRVLHVGAEGLGALRAAPALGAVAVSLLFAFRPMKNLSAARMLCAVTGFGLCMIGFGLSTSFALSMGLLALSGVCDSTGVMIRGTMMQLLTPEAMRGRVSSISSMFIISSNEIGAFESGVAARLLGLVPSVVAGGMVTLFVVAFVATVSPRFRKTVVEI